MVEMKMINGVQYQVEEGIYNPVVKESSFEKMGGTYRMEGEYLVPNLELKQERVALGKYGRMRENFLKEHKKTYYTSLKIQGQLMNHLQGVEKEAQRILEIEIPRYQKTWGVTEELKAQDQMKWVGMMNNIKASIEEIIQKEIIFS
ncbi:TnpV protein [Tissierella praeacuta]|uniref:TnpV protein n=2 Tax=Tissierellales TaxID=1737405 RepID=UPI0035E423FF